MKIAISGKGGVGKTTFAAVLARLYAADGKKVMAVDVDPDANLALALGFTQEEAEGITPISEMKELANERTGASGDSYGAYFKLNPKVDDIPDKFALSKNGVKLLVMGTVYKGGGGCVCPENAIVKSLMSHLIIQRDEIVIMDMEAGIEHLGRGTASNVDAFIVVVEPGSRSLQTYHSVKKLAADLGVRNIKVVANKARNADDEKFITDNVPAEDLLGIIHWNDEVRIDDMDCKSPFENEAMRKEIQTIKEKLQ